MADFIPALLGDCRNPSQVTLPGEEGIDEVDVDQVDIAEEKRSQSDGGIFVSANNIAGGNTASGPLRDGPAEESESTPAFDLFASGQQHDEQVNVLRKAEEPGDGSESSVDQSIFPQVVEPPSDNIEHHDGASLMQIKVEKDTNSTEEDDAEARSWFEYLNSKMLQFGEGEIVRFSK